MSEINIDFETLDKGYTAALFMNAPERVKYRQAEKKANDRRRQEKIARFKHPAVQPY